MLEILINTLQKETSHVIRDGSYGLAGKAFCNVLSRTKPIRVDSDRVDMLETALYFLWCNCNRMMATSQIFCEWFRQGICLAGQFKIVDINI